MSIFLLLTVALIALLFIWIAIATFYKHCFSYWKNKGVETLDPVIPFGDAWKFTSGKICFGEMFADWYLRFKAKGVKHGGAYFFGKPVYIPVDPQIIKKVVMSDSKYFPNHGFFIDDSGNDPLSLHLFNMEDYRWRTVRSKLPAAFTSAKMRKMFLTLKEVTNDLVNVIEENVEKQAPINIKPILTRFTTDTITSAIFGMQSKTLQNQNIDLLEHAKNFFDYQWSRINNTIVLLIPRYILKLMKFRIFTKAATKYFVNMFSNIIAHRSEEQVKRNDLTETLIRLSDANDELLKTDFEGKGKMEPLNVDELMAQMFVFFEAGFETSSSTTSFALYELSLNQDCQERLRREISKVLDKYNGDVSYEAIMEMEYLNKVVDETLRKYPIFPVVARACIKDYYIPEYDFTIDKGTFVMVTNLGIQRDSEYYPDPDKFDPERFTTENKGKRPFVSYLPFGEGPRICIGKRVGLMQTKLGLVAIIRNYEVTLSSKTKQPFEFDKRGIILKMEGGVWLDIKKIHSD